MIDEFGTSFAPKHSVYIWLDDVITKLRASTFAKAPARCELGRLAQLHVINDVGPEFAALDLRGALHQAREIVSDAFAGDSAI